MDKAVVHYVDKGSTHYNGKQYVYSISKLKRDKSAKGSLAVGEFVTIKTKSRA